MKVPSLYFEGQLLVAMPAMPDPRFERSVIYLCAHSEEGAMGIVINRPLEIELGEVLSQMELNIDDPEVALRPVYQGGPVHQDRGFVIHRPAREWSSTITINREVGVSTSRDILEAISTGEGPGDTLVALGYAGWGAGQLEEEMTGESWFLAPGNADLLFNTPARRKWAAIFAASGVDSTHLVGGAGLA